MGGLVDKRSLHTKLIYTVKASSLYFLWFTKKTVSYSKLDKHIDNLLLNHKIKSKYQHK